MVSHIYGNLRKSPEGFLTDIMDIDRDVCLLEGSSLESRATACQVKPLRRIRVTYYNQSEEFGGQIERLG
jgi:hypothetical protein